MNKKRKDPFVLSAKTMGAARSVGTCSIFSRSKMFLISTVEIHGLRVPLGIVPSVLVLPRGCIDAIAGYSAICNNAVQNMTKCFCHQEEVCPLSAVFLQQLYSHSPVFALVIRVRRLYRTVPFLTALWAKWVRNNRKHGCRSFISVWTNRSMCRNQCYRCIVLALRRAPLPYSLIDEEKRE